MSFTCCSLQSIQGCQFSDEISIRQLWKGHTFLQFLTLAPHNVVVKPFHVNIRSPMGIHARHAGMTVVLAVLRDPSQPTATPQLISKRAPSWLVPDGFTPLGALATASTEGRLTGVATRSSIWTRTQIPYHRPGPSVTSITQPISGLSKMPPCHVLPHRQLIVADAQPHAQRRCAARGQQRQQLAGHVAQPRHQDVSVGVVAQPGVAAAPSAWPRASCALGLNW